MPNTYVRLLAQAFDDLAALTAGTGIPPAQVADFRAPVTVRQALRCVSNILPLRPGPEWHLQWGKRMAENFHGAITVAGLTAPSLGDGLDVFVRYMPARVPYLDWRSRLLNGSFRCTVMPWFDLGAAGQMLIEVPLIVLHEYVQVMRPGALTDARLELAYPPTAYRACYARYFDCPVHFGRPYNALVIPAAWRAIRNIDFDAVAWRVALERCEAMAYAIDERDLVSRLRRTLADALLTPGPGGLPTLDQLARHLRCSTRTIIRRLRALDSTFQKETETVLRTHAIALLADPANRVQDIATRLGYADAAGFRKAFKRWFGVTPGAWRGEG